MAEQETFEVSNDSEFEYVDVMDLATGKVHTYWQTNPLKACALAYLQADRGDMNTWNYGRMLVSGDLVSITCGGVQHLTAYAKGKLTARVGNFSAFLDGKRIG